MIYSSLPTRASLECLIRDKSLECIIKLERLFAKSFFGFTSINSFLMVSTSSTERPKRVDNNKIENPFLGRVCKVYFHVSKTTIEFRLAKKVLNFTFVSQSHECRNRLMTRATTKNSMHKESVSPPQDIPLSFRLHFYSRTIAKQTFTVIGRYYSCDDQFFLFSPSQILFNLSSNVFLLRGKSKPVSIHIHVDSTLRRACEED